MIATLRRFLFRVRKLHRETVASYTARILAANFESHAHKEQLITLCTPSKAPAVRAPTWIDILRVKTGQPSLTFDERPDPTMIHLDGTSCDGCTRLIPERWMCTHCSHGARVQQQRHFDTIVCIRHSRWVGLNTTPERQHPASDALLRAQLRFQKLRRRRLIDPRLFEILTTALASSLETEDLSGAETFPDVVNTAWALTRHDFAATFFNPATPYDQAFQLMSTTLRETLGEDRPELARKLWLYARPTFWAIRHSILTDAPFTPGWAHDMPFDPDIASSFASTRDDLEPFANYHLVTGDDPVKAFQVQYPSRTDRIVRSVTPQSSGKRIPVAICANGHEVYTVITQYPAWQTSVRCGVCHGRLVQPGYNDLASSHPKIAAEFDTDLNDGLTSQSVSAVSKVRRNWRCPNGHSYSTSPWKRTAGKSNCPVCVNRLIVAGINDLATTHPLVAAEWDPGYLTIYPPTGLSAGSNTSMQWVCAHDHQYSMRVVERVRLGRCPECLRQANIAANLDLARTHPDLAKEWHPQYNGTQLPSDFTHASANAATWLCPLGHVYKQRIRRRVAGYECSVCARPTVVPLVNDLATTHPVLITEFHPYLNGSTSPSAIVAGTELYWWRCIALRHKTRQSVPRRLASKGCIECAASERILA